MRDSFRGLCSEGRPAESTSARMCFRVVSRRTPREQFCSLFACVAVCEAGATRTHSAENDPNIGGKNNTQSERPGQSRGRARHPEDKEEKVEESRRERNSHPMRRSASRTKPPRLRPGPTTKRWKASVAPAIWSSAGEGRRRRRGCCGHRRAAADPEGGPNRKPRDRRTGGRASSACVPLRIMQAAPSRRARSSTNIGCTRLQGVRRCHGPGRRVRAQDVLAWDTGDQLLAPPRCPMRTRFCMFPEAREQSEETLKGGVTERELAARGGGAAGGLRRPLRLPSG